ncbi:hypothetical protein EYF80_023412 [Liparis tanakae]|uniref:Uncharacterized protein n=1 Tax=Liparis tanakae TaxID=230148 RepID=A0A4Z2HN25_9TELE|nr:hypothetical protein EYF80_023412 [Liparis tanakae]
MKLGEQVRGSGVDAELELHGAAHMIPDLDLHRAARLQGQKETPARLGTALWRKRLGAMMVATAHRFILFLFSLETTLLRNSRRA